MYLDSNVLLAQILDNHDVTRTYADAAFNASGLLISEVLVEVLAKAERVTRQSCRNVGEPFSEAVYHKSLANLVLSWYQDKKVFIEDIDVLTALTLMSQHGLDYVDCLLCTLAADGNKVATSDKDMIAHLGSSHWEP